MKLLFARQFARQFICPPVNLRLLLWATVIVILWTPSVLACSCRAGIAYVRANMHTLQTRVEAYALNHSGHYPESIAVLYAAAQAKDDWQDFTSPYTHQRTSKGSKILNPLDMNRWKQLTAQRTTQYRFGLRVRAMPQDAQHTAAERVHAGSVLYDYQAPNGYRIYGLDDQGKLIRDRKGYFFLSHD